jgi:hypothetical protein
MNHNGKYCPILQQPNLTANEYNRVFIEHFLRNKCHLAYFKKHSLLISILKAIIRTP